MLRVTIEFTNLRIFSTLCSDVIMDTTTVLLTGADMSHFSQGQIEESAVFNKADICEINIERVAY